MLVLGGCVAEDEDKDSNASPAALAVSELNGFWDGGFNGNENLRALIYNGRLYGFDETHGFSAELVLNSAERSVSHRVQALALNAGSEPDSQQLIADGSAEQQLWDTQITGLTVSNDSLFGPYFNADSNFAAVSSAGNLQLSRDGTWQTPSSLAQLARIGKWTANGYELVTSTVTQSSGNSVVTFTGTSVNESGGSVCSFRGQLSLIDTSVNLYRAQLLERRDCPGFNLSAAELADHSGFAGFNSEGDFEFFFQARDAALSTVNALLFMRFTPPPLATPSEPTTPPTTPAEGEDDAEGGDDEAGEA